MTTEQLKTRLQTVLSDWETYIKVLHGAGEASNSMTDKTVSYAHAAAMKVCTTDIKRVLEECK